jgi:SAM-dependent methyltransferase
MKKYKTIKGNKCLNFSDEMINYLDKCPICHSNLFEITDTIPIELLKLLWRKLYKIDFTGINNNIEIKLNKCLSCGLLYYTPQLLADARLYDILQEKKYYRQDKKKYYIQDKSEFMTAMNYIVSSDSVLEIGIGDGAFSRKLTCKSYVGLELSKRAIGIAKLLNMQPNRLIIEENIENHVINNAEKYDIVCFFQVLEHISQLTLFLKASIDCLKKGGKLIISVPSEDSWLAHERNSLLNAPPHHLTRWTSESLIKLAGLFNLKLINIEQDKLSEYDMGNYSVLLIQNFICKLLKIKYRSMDYRFAADPVRYSIRVMAYLLRIFIRFRKMRPIGHSVTAIYEK